MENGRSSRNVTPTHFKFVQYTLKVPSGCNLKDVFLRLQGVLKDKLSDSVMKQLSR